MKRELIHVFDLDNTLVYTDALNKDAYNYALKQLGLEVSRITTSKRITRDVVFHEYPELSVQQKDELIILKQCYFAENLIDTVANTSLVKILESCNKEFCVLWTSADRVRVLAILKHYKIHDAFQMVFYSPKVDIVTDVKAICKFLKCDSNKLLFYEDDKQIIDKLEKLKLNVINVCGFESISWTR